MEESDFSLKRSVLGFGMTAVVMTVHSCAFAGTLRQGCSDQIYTDFSAAEAYDSVGMFNGTSSGGSHMGSDTLISDNWVLTVGHAPDPTNLAIHQQYGSAYFTNSVKPDTETCTRK